ncbi:EF_hand domain-containing protein [Hexamita inflata]|uniref:EF hand domain-containing protein n=1 Tax=Hexamita inflata TaxID=28002 RepID=A0AA86QLX2_9EUKA|nr:EF hand domain-containing protein [Hexamita inflata]
MLSADYYDKQIRLDQFCQFMYICENADYNDNVSVLFYAADLSQSGYLEKQQVQKIVKKLKLGMVYNEVSSLVEMYADNFDGTVSYTVYKQIIKQLRNTQNEQIRKQQLRDNFVEPQNIQTIQSSKLDQKQTSYQRTTRNRSIFSSSKKLKLVNVEISYI